MRRAPFTIILLPAPPSATRRCLQDMEAIRTSGDEILIIAPDGEDPALRRRFPWAASIPAYQGHGTRDLVLFLHPDVVMSRHAAAALAEAMTDESIVAVGPRMEAATNEGQSISDPDYHPMREADVRNFARQWRQMHPTPPRGVATLSEFCLLTRRRFLPADGPSRVEDVAALLDGMAQERGRLAVADGAFVHRYRHWLLADQAARTLSGPRVSVCLIVKDEEQHLPECLASLSGIADEIVVYDTGSTDATVDIARRAGARVVDGYWDDDFGRARNDAVSHCSGEWVLWLDADERLVGDIPGLRQLLSQPLAVEGFLVNIDNLQGNEISSRSSHRALRIFRRCRGRWEGRLHEQIVAVDSHNGLTVAVLEPVHLVHLGYLATTMTERNKLERNLRLALADVESPDGESRALKLQNVGRSLAALGRHDEALEYLNRSLAAATLPLVRRLSNRVGAEVLLALGRHDEALEWVDRLRALSERGDLADVLEAKIRLAMGEPERVIELLDGLGDDGGIDDDGTTVDPAEYAVDKANAYLALGRHGEGADALLGGMRAHGRLNAHVGVLADMLLNAGRDLSEIADALPSERREDFVAQLLQLPAPSADRILEALHVRYPDDRSVLAAAATVACSIDLSRALDWSARLRLRGLGSACPLIARAGDDTGPAPDRVLAAAIAFGTFADPRAQKALTSAASRLAAPEVAAVRQHVEVLCPALLEDFDASAPRGNGLLGADVAESPSPSSPPATAATRTARSAPRQAAPRVSVCIPTWNHERMVVEALDSVMAQDFDDFEVIVSDDASSDATLEVARSYMSDSRVRVVANSERAGITGNYRRCIELARGDYIKILNADDVLDPGALSSMVPHFADPAVSLVSGHWRYFQQRPGDMREAPLPSWAQPGQAVKASGREFAQLSLTNTMNWCGCPTMSMFRRADLPSEQYGRLGGEDWYFAGDYATWLNLMTRGDVVWLTEPAWWLRVHADQASNFEGNGPLEALECLYFSLIARDLGIYDSDGAFRTAVTAACRRLLSSPDILAETRWTNEVITSVNHALSLLASSTADAAAGGREIAHLAEVQMSFANVRHRLSGMLVPAG